MKLRFAASAVVVVLLLVLPRVAAAFCGFYVSGADAKLFADATQVVMMREGTRTVLSMQNDYAGPPSDFAMVVPVPVVLQKENVKTLPRELFAKVDALSAPRLVEYWEQDPCQSNARTGDLKFGAGGGLSGIGGGALAGIGGTTVKIEAQFEVGEYEILILSAQDSGGLERWLREHGYEIPDNAEPALRPYVQSGSKFFVAKVNVAKVKLENGRAQLSPLRFHYDADTFTLPVRLGMLNSSGFQDLIVEILAPSGQRYDVANYAEATIPTNLDVAESARASFPTFYATLFDKTLEVTPGAVVTEYAWGAQSCDPCPGSVQGLTNDELATLGADVLPSARKGPIATTPVASVELGAVKVTGGAESGNAMRVTAGLRPRFRQCYQVGLGADPTQTGRVTLRATVDASGAVTNATVSSNTGLSPEVTACMSRSLLRATFSPGTGTGTIEIPLKLVTSGDPAPPPPASSGPRLGLQGIAGDFVLTRLHARYARGGLGEDLVFKAAGKISGGRENRDATGRLETGAVAASVNAFQGRYAIRHGWPGPVACDKPVRGRWGGPWPDAGVASSQPVAATKLAYAPRGGATLVSFVPGGVPELAFLGSKPPTPAPAPSGDPTSTPSDGGQASGARGARCGCDVVGGARGGYAATALGLLGWIIAWRRRPR